MITEQDIMFIKLLFEMIEEDVYDVTLAETKLRDYANTVNTENKEGISTAK